MKYKFFIGICGLAISIFSYAQPVTKGTEVQELVWVSEVYANTSNLSFSIKYTFADSLTPATLVDSTTMSCKISRGRSFVSNDEIEYLQGREYNVYVNKMDSIVMLGPVENYKAMFKAPLLDSNFRKGHVTGMATGTINDSTRKLTVSFKPESYYVSYTMLYDPRTGFIKSICYCIRNPREMYGLPADHILQATIKMTGYSSVPVAAILFNENRYFYKLNGNFYLQQEW